MGKRKHKNKLNCKTQEEMDFQIHFYENVLNRTPDFIEALSAIAELYTKKGLFDKGLQVDKRLAELRPDDPYVLYNLACSYSLVNDINKAMATITKAIEKGYCDFSFLEQDKDLDNLLKDDTFRKYLTQLKRRSSSKSNKSESSS